METEILINEKKQNDITFENFKTIIKKGGINESYFIY